MKIARLSVIIVTATLLLFFAGCSGKKESNVNQNAPDFSLKDLDGNTVKLSDYKDKVIIIDFWATWCPPCREEIPNFVDLQKKYGMQGLIVIGIALDESGARDVKPFSKKNQINYPVLIGDNVVTDSYGGIRGIPTRFIINKKGLIVEKFVGFREKEVFEKKIKELL